MDKKSLEEKRQQASDRHCTNSIDSANIAFHSISRMHTLREATAIELLGIRLYFIKVTNAISDLHERSTQKQTIEANNRNSLKIKLKKQKGPEK